MPDYPRDNLIDAMSASPLCGSATITAISPTTQPVPDLVAGSTYLELRNVHAGYGKMEVVHGIDLRVGRAQSICLIGPNGAGKSTLLNAIAGLANLLAGDILLGGKSISHASPNTMLRDAKLAYVLQNSSVFSDMTVEENLLVGGYVLSSRYEAARAVSRIFDTHPQLASRRKEAAGALSGGERRILELSRALITDPDILLVDEPSIGLDPRAIDAIFKMLDHLQRADKKTIMIVEQNVRSGLEFADIGYVLVAGRLVLADRATKLLQNADVGRLFMGG